MRDISGNGEAASIAAQRSTRIRDDRDDPSGKRILYRMSV